jgi:hypothetical protein
MIEDRVCSHETLPPGNGRIREISTTRTTTKMSSSVSSFFSSIFPVVHADSEEKPAEAKQEGAEVPDSEAAAAEEEEEPEDVSYELSCFGQVDDFWLYII